MCGIVGYVGDRDAFPILLNSLERVTYSGYDSFGVALLNGQGIEVFKSVGTVKDVSRPMRLRRGMYFTLGAFLTEWSLLVLK